jgi:hypothetical protein
MTNAASTTPGAVTVYAAVVTAGLALMGTLVGLVVNWKLHERTVSAQQALENLKDELSQRSAENDARRDYVYEARKRLYEACEPILFQSYERSYDAYGRILNLADAARRGDVRPGGGWLASESRYYFTSMIYRFLAPMALFRLLQERLTAVDLTLDDSIRYRYTLLKMLVWSTTDAFVLARLADLRYDPNAPTGIAGHSRRLARRPEESRTQGLTSGRLELALDEMIVGAGGQRQVQSYGDFSNLLQGKTGKAHEALDLVSQLFYDFHPAKRPVLWLVLVTHAHIHRALLDIPGSEVQEREGERVERSLAIPTVERRLFDWRRDASQARDDDVLVRPFRVAEAYLLPRISARSPIESLSGDMGSRRYSS